MANRKDVAREANVSTTAVSYFTNGNGYLSQEKRERIEAAIKKLNYRPNPVAKNLKMNDSKQLALFFKEFSNPYHSQLANVAMLTARERGYSTLVANYVDDDYVLDLCRYMISGVLICTYDVSEETVKKIAEMDIPVVILGGRQITFESPLVTQITFDYGDAVKEILTLMQGHQKKYITYVGHNVSQSAEAYSDDKTAVLEQLCQEESTTLKLDKILVNVESVADTYEVIVNRFAKKLKRPEVLLCADNSVALVVLRALADANISIPDEVEVVAFDDTIYSRTSVPKLSVVDLDADYVSKLATDYLIKKCQKEKVFDVKITQKLLHRESTIL